MTNPELLSIKDIARRLNIPESSIRYYRDKFMDFLPYVGEGRRKRYRSQAIEVFEYIIQAYKQEKSAAQIEQELAQRFPRNLNVEKDFNPQSKKELQPKDYYPAYQADQALLQTQARVLEQLTDILSENKNQMQEMHQISNEQSKLKRALILLSKDYKKFRYSLQGDKDDFSNLQNILSQYKEENEALRQKMNELEDRQANLEKRLEEKLSGLQKELEKNQFWTKRLILQAKKGESQDASNENG